MFIGIAVGATRSEAVPEEPLHLGLRSVFEHGRRRPEVQPQVVEYDREEAMALEGVAVGTPGIRATGRPGEPFVDRGPTGGTAEHPPNLYIR